MGATLSLPTLEPAIRAVCNQVADRLDLEADDVAATMTAAVLDEIPHYAAGPRQVVFVSERADDLSAATAMAKGCPVLTRGGTVEVYETFQVM